MFFFLFVFCDVHALKKCHPVGQCSKHPIDIQDGDSSRDLKAGSITAITQRMPHTIAHDIKEDDAVDGNIYFHQARWSLIVLSS